MADKGPSRLTAAAALAGTEFVHVIQGQTCTITIASPGVVTATAHGKAENDQVIFSTTGALPTGLAVDTVYYVRNPAADTFEVSATSGGSSINTSGSQSGTHTVFGNSRRATISAIAGVSHTHAESDVTGLTAALAGKLDDSQAGATGLSVLGAASESAARAAIGAVIGTHVQAYDAQLTDLAGLSYGGNALKVVRVNAGETAFELATASSSYSGGVQSIPILASAMTARTTNGAASGTTETTTNKVMLATLDFDQSTEEYAQFMFPMPKSWDESTVTAQFIWTASSGTGDVIWGIQGVAISEADALDAAFGTAGEVTDTLTTADDNHTTSFTSPVTIGGTPAEGDLVCFQVYRKAADVSDTLTADAKLIGIRLNITTNAADDS